MSKIEFRPWGKTARLFRDVIVTEKLDGTNAAVGIVPLDPEAIFSPNTEGTVVTGENGSLSDAVVVYAQSRNRLITPENDNAGFARWVESHAAELVELLGEGLHFGEWWGQGIGRKYGLTEKRFSLFNVDRWQTLPERPPFPGMAHILPVGAPAESLVYRVPTLYRGPFDTALIRNVVTLLESEGSRAAPGFMNPEGIVTFHTASQVGYKTTIENDEISKGEAEARKAKK